MRRGDRIGAGTTTRREALFLRNPAGRRVGKVPVGSATPEPEALRNAIAGLAQRGRARRAPWPIRAGLAVTVDAHGADGQALRDPILRDWRRLPD